MFGKDFNLDNDEVLKKIKIEFKKLIEEANELNNNKKIGMLDMNKNQDYINLLESNIKFIEDEYKNNIDFIEYNQAINILNNNIINLKNRIDGFKI